MSLKSFVFVLRYYNYSMTGSTRHDPISIARVSIGMREWLVGQRCEGWEGGGGARVNLA